MFENKALTIIRILGMKNRIDTTLLQAIVSKAEEEGAIMHIETCIGGAGLQPTRMLSQPEKAKWIINDKESRKSDLYTVLYQYPFTLIATCKKIKSDIYPYFIDKANNTYKKEKDNIHTTILTQIQRIDHISSKTESDKIIQAAITMLDYAGVNKKIEKQFTAFEENLSNIKFLYSRLKASEVTITNEDLFDIIKEYKNKKNVILYIDPPYYLTDGGYPENCEDRESHKRLVDLLHKTSCKWVLFCRTQASRAYNSNNNSTLIDDALKSFYDNHYLSKGYYYSTWKCNKTEELVITNFKFKNCKSYYLRSVSLQE
ncbi:MAG: hypothetical protein HDT22_08435 [Ruminococcus sp.]|nr:hypothetical protein [Ruminococcus sp.]